MKARIALTILLLTTSFIALPLGAQESKPTGASPLPRAEVQTAVFTLQHADAKAVKKLLDDFTEYLSGSISCDAGSRSIAVVGSKELVAACTEAIRRLDAPSKFTKNIDFTFYILVASKKAIPDGDCPAAIRSFCDQMKDVYKGFRLLETMSMRAVEGKEDIVRGIIAATEPGGDVMPYRLDFIPRLLMSGGKDSKPIIRVEINFNVTVTTRKASAYTTQDVGIGSNVDIREGQEVGITTVSQGTPGESLCIVVKAKMLD